MAYGNTAPPEGAPVPAQELIGAALFLGLVAVVSISRHGAYLIGFLLGRYPVDPAQLTLFAVNVAGFAASLWLLALRRWAWQAAVAYAALEACLRLAYMVAYLLPALGSPGHLDLLGAVGEVLLGLVFLVVAAYLLGEDTRAMLEARERYRVTAEA
jgi:hypothetical protein